MEELVAGIEVESLFDAGAPRGKQRTAIVRITYRFRGTGRQPTRQRQTQQRNGYCGQSGLCKC